MNAVEIEGRPSKQLQLLAWALAVLPLAFLIWRFWWLCDDAFISFRYSKHLAGGHGLRYNLADTPIEGYSNFLWVVWLSFWHWIGAAIPTVAPISSILAALGLIAVMVRHSARNLGGGLLSLSLGALFLACLPPIGVWSTSGLATMPTVLLVFLCWDRLIGDPAKAHGRSAALFAALGVLMRADALLFLGLVHVCAFLTGLFGSDKPRLRASVSSGVITLLTFGAQTLFRVLYHGDWMPNTARVKVDATAITLERGLNYDVTFLLAYVAIPVALLLALVLPGRLARSQRLSAWAMVLAVFGYGVFIGGDFMTMGRMLVLSLPFVAVLFASSVAGVMSWKSRPLGVGLAGLVTILCFGSSGASAFNIHLTPRAWREPFHFRWSKPFYTTELEFWTSMDTSAKNWMKLGKVLNHRTRRGESLVTGTIGGVGYYSNLHIYDPFGLVNREWKHSEVRQKRKSPGHDRHIPVKIFLAKDPTYVNAELVPEDQRDYMLLPVLRPDFEFAHRIEVGFFPLKNDPRLLRLARWK